MTVACVACAAKLHSGGAAQPAVTTQEVNRCLSVVRAAARRGSPIAVMQRRHDVPVADPPPAPAWQAAQVA